MAKTFELDIPIEGHTHCLLLTRDEINYVAFVVGQSSSHGLGEMPHTLWKTGNLAQFKPYKYKWRSDSIPVVISE